MAKKTPESKEDAAARRQRELALLTSGVAAFSLMGEASRPEPAAAAPAPVEAAAPAEPVPAATPASVVAQPASLETEGKKDETQPLAAPAVVKATPKATASAKRGGEGPASPSATRPTATPTAAPTPTEEEEEEADLEATLPEPPAVMEPGELDLARLFVPSSEKKGTTLRITADHQQFFTNLGFLLGNGASAPDIIHNILNRFRADHEAQIQKAMKKQMRQLMSPKK